MGLECHGGPLPVPRLCTDGGFISWTLLTGEFYSWELPRNFIIYFILVNLYVKIFFKNCFSFYL